MSVREGRCPSGALPLACSLLLAAGGLHGCAHREGPGAPAAPPSRCATEAACAAGCGAGETEACARQAEVAVDRGALARERPAVTALLQRACAGGVARACARATWLSRDADGGADPATLAQARARLPAACAAGEAESCEWWARLGGDPALGVDAGPAARDALAGYEARCAAADALGCLRAGALLADGQLVARDLTRALARLNRACDLGLAGGCAALGLRYLTGAGVTADRGAAQRYLHRAGALSGAFDAGAGRPDGG